MKKSLLIVVALVVAGWYAYGLQALARLQRERNTPALELDMQSISGNSVTQVFFDMGRGIREDDSVPCFLTVEPRTWVYRFRIPPGRLQAVRFDPLASPGEIVVHSARIADGKGKVIREIPLTAFKALNEIQALEAQPGGLRILMTAAALDPQVGIDLGGPVDFTGYDHLPTAAWMKLAGWHTASVAALLGLAYALWVLCGPARWRRWTGIAPIPAPAANAETALPVELTLLLASALAVLLVGVCYLEQTLFKLAT